MQQLVKLVPIVGIFVFVSMAWLVLSGTMLARSQSQQGSLSYEVGDLWGGMQAQHAPVFTLRWTTQYEKKVAVYNEENEISDMKIEFVTNHHQRRIDPNAADIASSMELNERRKGLVWFPMYTVDFDGKYDIGPIDTTLIDAKAEDVELEIAVHLPDGGGTYDGFSFLLDGRDVSGRAERKDGGLVYRLPVKDKQTMAFRFGYISRGLESWTYEPLPRGNEAGLIENFSMVMNTDFLKIDFPAGSMSPSTKERTSEGWELAWTFERILTGQSIGMVMPERVQPGELGAKLSASAPISLGFFTVVLYVITFLRGYRVHPIHYAFIGAAFFSFHLLFAYTADHLPVEWAFTISSATSVFLVVSYMRLVVSNRFAFGPVAIAQLIYVVGFSIAHFFTGFTGLAITLLGILTLFWLMQTTGRIDWYGDEAGDEQPGEPEPAAA
jgi:hypothetical protein